MTTHFKYGIISLAVVLVWHINANAQETNTNNQAIVTIIGDPVQANTSGDFINTNPYTENNAPPAQQQIAKSDNQNIEPTLENGFHMRFEVNSDYVNHGGSLSSSAYSSSGSGSSAKAKKQHSITIAERSFNAKKRIKSWLPEHKKKYHPHLCGRF